MKYRKFSAQEKIDVVEAINSGLSIADAARILDINTNTIAYWMTKDEFNPDKEYVRIRTGWKATGKPAPKDPFPGGVEMAESIDPQELVREIRDLRKKNAYLEDKVAYLEALYEIIKKDPGAVSKKNDAEQSRNSLKRDTPT